MYIDDLQVTILLDSNFSSLLGMSYLPMPTQIYKILLSDL